MVCVLIPPTEVCYKALLGHTVWVLIPPTDACYKACWVTQCRYLGLPQRSVINQWCVQSVGTYSSTRGLLSNCGGSHSVDIIPATAGHMCLLYISCVLHNVGTYPSHKGHVI